MDYFYIACLLALIPAFIAKSKGHSFFTWWLYGLIIIVIAIPHSIILRQREFVIDVPTQPVINVTVATPTYINSPHTQNGTTSLMKVCPRCAEEVKEAARACRFCDHEFVPTNDTEVLPPLRTIPQRIRRD